MNPRRAVDAAHREAHAGRPPHAHVRRAAGDADRRARGARRRRHPLGPAAAAGEPCRPDPGAGSAATTATSRCLRIARPRGRAARAPTTRPITSVMTTDVSPSGAAPTLSRAVELMLQHRHTALPVVEPDGRLVGLVSEADVLGDPLYEQARAAPSATVMTTRRSPSTPTPPSAPPATWSPSAGCGCCRWSTRPPRRRRRAQ